MKKQKVLLIIMLVLLSSNLYAGFKLPDRIDFEITQKWCQDVMTSAGGPGSSGYHYKDILECVKFTPFEIGIPAGVDHLEPGEKAPNVIVDKGDIYWGVIVHMHTGTEEEYDRILEEGYQNNAFSGRNGGTNFYETYLQRKYKSVELLKQAVL